MFSLFAGKKSLPVVALVQVCLLCKVLTLGELNIPKWLLLLRECATYLRADRTFVSDKVVNIYGRCRVLLSGIIIHQRWTLRLLLIGCGGEKIEQHGKGTEGGKVVPKFRHRRAFQIDRPHNLDEVSRR